MARTKRKISTLAQDAVGTAQSLPPIIDSQPPPPKRQARHKVSKDLTNPNQNSEILDGAEALRASPDATEKSERLNVAKIGLKEQQVKAEDESPPSLVEDQGSESSLSELSDLGSPSQPIPKKPTKSNQKKAKVVEKEEKSAKQYDPEAEDEEDGEADEEEIQSALSRPPPINSDYLPLPWKGRIGYACLNTYLRFSNPPVFSSRTCRIASIIENRHPLKNPDEPAHPTKNRPDKDQPADVARGQTYVEGIGLANARDIVKMLRWNDRYGIKFMRLSSEMFPFASHDEYGYKLAPFASEALADAGKVVAELGHRVTTHPGQFTQLGSPRKQVIDNAIRDLEYHAELLSLLKLPPQQDRDAVMILHLGGVFGDKEATLHRFRTNYARLSPDIKKRLVLENDDVSWSVHDLLPVCEELNIPFVLDFHHHNIIFDPSQIREGTKDIMTLFPRILATWKRKGITPKMHYSEPTPAAITGRQRRKHSPRVATLPPCPDDMDLMIEAKDKEQAVFELMRIFKLPKYDTFNNILPHVRQDDNKVVRTPKKKVTKKNKVDDLDNAEEEVVKAIIPEDEVGMGGPEGRVYWPPGMEDWLRPVKRVVKKKDTNRKTPAQKTKAEPKPKVEAEEASAVDASIAAPASAKKAETTSSKKPTPKKQTAKKSRGAKAPPPEPASPSSPPSPSLSDSPDQPPAPLPKRRGKAGAPSSSAARPARRGKRVSYVEREDVGGDEEEEDGEE